MRLPSWKTKYQQAAWDLIIYRIYREGLKYKANNVTETAARVGVTKGCIYLLIRNGSGYFNPDCPTIHKILSRYDPPLDHQFMCEPKNLWSRRLLAKV